MPIEVTIYWGAVLEWALFAFLIVIVVFVASEILFRRKK